VFRELLFQRVSGFCHLSASQLELLEQHYELMLHWNKTINMTRIEGVEESVDRHYAESLFLGSRLPAGRLRVADVGSGAGFPGIPIAVLRPELSVSLIESHRRKAVFLKEATRCLSNVKVISNRAEDVGERFDWIVSRAVSWRDLEGLPLASRLGLIGTDAPGTLIRLPWADDRHICFVSRETVLE